MEGDLLNSKARLPDHFSCSSRSQEADIVLDQALGQVEEASLVIDRDDSFNPILAGKP